MKILVISDLNLMRALVDSTLSKFGCTQINLDHTPDEITALLREQPVEMVVIQEQDRTADTLADLAAVLGDAPAVGEHLPKCLLVRRENTFHDEELRAYLDYIQMGALTLLLPDHLERNLVCYFEHHFRRSLPVYRKSRVSKADLPVLVVDDSAVIRRQVALALTHKGYTVLEAEDGQQGWEIYDTQNPVMVVTDISMPNITGIELCQRIKEKNPYTEVIVMSSMNHHKTTDLAFQAGADDYLIKPVHIGRLLTKVEKIIEAIIEKSKYRILIVDDDRFMRENLRRAFGKNSMEVITASNGLEGFTLAMLENPAVIITDIEMPVMGGYDLLTAVKSVRQLEQTTLIMMSGKFAKGKVKMTTNHAPIQFFAKPFDLDKMVMLTEQLVVNKSLQNSKEYDMLISSIMALVTALEARDMYTMGHSERVTTYSLLIGSRLGFNGHQLKILEMAASLHDIGKIGIRDDILMKPGRLTEQEFEVIKEHPYLGAKILDSIESLSYISKIILHHHEHFDGAGYPQGIRGKDIPLESRIIAVADTFDAVTYSRPYRNTPMERADAEGLLAELSGSQLCPACVSAFLTELNSEDLFAHDAFFVPRPAVYNLEPSKGNCQAGPATTTE